MGAMMQWKYGTADEDDLPVIPPLSPRRDIGPNPPIAKCGQCGLILHQVMWYSCSQPNCPCFPQVTC